MAQRRMFSLQVVDTDYFLDMPQTAQLLYFHLSMRADDDGFVDNWKKVMKIIGSSQDDLSILKAKRFILDFESGIIVIKHWRMNNYIQSDRYNETKYLNEKKLLAIKENGAYTESQQPVSIMDTQVRLGKVSLGESRLEATPAQKAEKFFSTTDEQHRIIEELVKKGIPLDIATVEVAKFVSYWTEPNSTGKKLRWQMEKTFELGRRFGTWFHNIKGINPKSKKIGRAHV